MSAGSKVTRKRRTSAPVRGEAIVRGVLGAALTELAEVGYGALRIEDVAARAGVNKTTVYRRWPTKEDLVRAALLSMSEESGHAPSTGSLRDDLLEIARRVVQKLRSPEGQGLARMIMMEGPDSELMTIATSLRRTFEAVPRAAIEAAQARGELAQDIDAMLIFDLLAGALHRRVLMDHEAIDDAFLARLVDLILHGALPREEPKAKPRSPSRSKQS